MVTLAVVETARSKPHMSTCRPTLKDLDTHDRFSPHFMAQLAERPSTVPGFNETCKLSSKTAIPSKTITNVLYSAFRKGGLRHLVCEPFQSASFRGEKKSTLDQTDWPSLAF